MQEESLQEPFVFGSVTDMHQKTCLDLLWASIWDPFGYPKSIPNRSGSDLPWHQVSDLESGALLPAGRKGAATLKPGPPLPDYIYTRRTGRAKARPVLCHIC